MHDSGGSRSTVGRNAAYPELRENQLPHTADCDIIIKKAT